MAKIKGQEVMAKNDGGPAFPTRGVSGIDVGGMSLRDWFAGQAMAGSDLPSIELGAKLAAKQAYWLADAMLAERDR